MIKELVHFLMFPTQVAGYRGMSFSSFFKFLLLKFALAIPFVLILVLAGADELDHKLDDDVFDNPWLFTFFLVCLAPLLEELVFRLHLDLKKSHILWGLGMSLLTFRDIWVPFALTFIYLLYLLISVYTKKPPEMKWVILISSVWFGILHLANYSDLDYGRYFYLIPFLIGSQVCGGLVLSFIRLNYGMKWAILIHATFNAILFLPTLFVE